MERGRESLVGNGERPDRDDAVDVVSDPGIS